ncbi:hypothetical protein CHARACLAT_032764 [Characodon lateralis]|uniref:Uncharacterized protein n=1 Tax=Characodon lateralis TaxID=208331 RepID=A0ABU7DW46_9TELE|nr:hypothetical protein [Characodon lateralis]
MVPNRSDSDLHAQATAEQRRNSVLLQHPVVAFPLEALLGEVLRADVAVLCWLEVAPPHRCDPLPTDIRTGQRKSDRIHDQKNDPQRQRTSDKTN